MKSRVHRDRIVAEFDVIGFEMEAAGTWDTFPTVVIKGKHVSLRKNQNLLRCTRSAQRLLLRG